jgi:hypothetical protein
MILRAYRTLSLQLLAHNRGDFARLLMAKGNHKRRFAGSPRFEMLLDRPFPQFHAIGDLFDDSIVLQLLPARLKPPCFQILDRCFQCGHLLPLRLEQFDIPDGARLFENAQRIPTFDRPVLSAVAGQEQPRIILSCMFHEAQHLRYAQHRCLVNHKHIRAFRPKMEPLKRSCLESSFP